MNKINISDDKALLDIHKIYQFLTNESTWAKGIDFQTVKISIDNSICIGAYNDHMQVGYCRIITDHATFGNLVDVIVWPEYRGLGISKLLMDAVLNHPSVKNIRRFTLATSNAHGLYAKFGFSQLSKPETFMERYDPNIYLKTL
ncbi:GNAT family N-acetyltransferase [Paraglaciecola sp.]|uniref:GNAT family N-acetyltransferase n=1 Tax=Paraglaciecola sp. TaxID=1920173 RepID=UPI0030F46392